MGKSRVLMLKF